MAVKIENLAPGLTMMFSCVTFVLNFSETYFASASRKIGIPLACPYFKNPLSNTSFNAFFTIVGGKKSGSPTSI